LGIEKSPLKWSKKAINALVSGLGCLGIAGSLVLSNPYNKWSGLLAGLGSWYLLQAVREAQQAGKESANREKRKTK
jgi:hypothetical protein